MSDHQNADKLRDAIARDQGWTLCRCGHYLAACADCMGWMRDNLSRIATAWEWWWIKAVELGQEIGSQWGSDAAEADDLAYYWSVR